MITLYHAPHSRSSGIIWLLEELEVPYKIEITPIVYGNGQGTPAPESYRAVHPHKKVPAIDHDGVKVFESIAIALYLADRFPAKGLAPALDDPRRGPYVTWLAYWAGVMNPVVTARFRGWDKDPAGTGFGQFDDMEKFIDTTLQAHPYIVGNTFTAADVLVGGAVEFFMGAGVFAKNKVREDYLARLAGRPARKRALDRDNG